VKVKRVDGTEETVTINVQRGYCPATIVCAEGEILDIDFYSCECKALHAAEGTLFDTKTMTGAYARLNKDEKFTIREWALATGGFEWSNYDAGTTECATQVSVWEEPNFMRYRHIVLEASTAECRGDLTQTKVVDGETISQTFNVVVWPERVPTSVGTLFELDTWTLASTIELEANVDFTFRFSEKATTTALGYTWVKPSKATWDCVTLEDNDFETFVTGYQQMVFKSLDKDVDCEEVVDLVRNDGTATETVTIKVFRGRCPTVECDDVSILDLDPKSCECKPLEATEGTVFDSRTLTAATSIVKLTKGAKFTVREWVMTDGQYEWSAFDATTLDCVDEASAYMEPIYGRYRHMIFETVTADCTGSLTQDKVVDGETIAQTFTVKVWPERQPEEQGTLIDLDTWTLADTINVDGNAQFTIRTSEMTEPGYTWTAPLATAAFTCMTLETTNYGDFNTGY
jgi:hypothetical protein